MSGKNTSGIKNTSINMFIIREIFKTINNRDITADEFYMKLLGVDEKRKTEGGKKDAYIASDIYANFVNRATLRVSPYIEEIKKWGFTEAFFMDNQAILIDAPEECIYKIIYYLQDSSLYGNEDFRENVIIPNIFEFKNADGTLIIDCVKEMIDEIVSEKNTNQDTTAEILEYVTNYSSDISVSQQVIKNFYNEIGKSFDKEKQTYELIQLPETDTFNSKKRIFVTSDNEKIKQNLLLIREAYAMMAEMDGNKDAMKNFYLYLECTENEYNDYIRHGNIPTRKLAKKIQSFKFPATLFKGESPCDIDITNYALYSLNSNVDIDDVVEMKKFRNMLRLALFYRIDTRNIPFFMAVYSMYNSLVDENFDLANIEPSKENMFPQKL